MEEEQGEALLLIGRRGRAVAGSKELSHLFTPLAVFCPPTNQALVLSKRWQLGGYRGRPWPVADWGEAKICRPSTSRRITSYIML